MEEPSAALPAPQDAQQQPSKRSQRFRTTLSSALDATAARFGEIEDRSKVVQDLRERKINNTRTSIVFGFDNPPYESDAMSRQKDILRAFADAQTSQHGGECKTLKLALASSSFSIGDKSERTEYGTSMQSALGHEDERYKWQNIQKYRGKLDPTIDKFIKTSSVHMGSEPRSYEVASEEAMRYRGGMIDYKKNHEESTKLRKQLVRHNFELAHLEDGPEDPVLRKESSQNAAYKYDFDAYQGARAVLSQDAKNDLRREHFSLGYTETKYTSTARENSKNGVLSVSVESLHADRERAKQLKQQLLKTSVVIGNDEDFM